MPYTIFGCSLMIIALAMGRNRPSGYKEHEMDFNLSRPRTQNIKLLCYSQSKNRLHRNPLYFVTSVVGAGNREGKFE